MGETVQGSYTFETTSPDLGPDSNEGVYDEVEKIAVSFQSGLNWTSVGPSGNVIQTFNDKDDTVNNRIEDTKFVLGGGSILGSTVDGQDVENRERGAATADARRRQGTDGKGPAEREDDCDCKLLPNG